VQDVKDISGALNREVIDGQQQIASLQPDEIGRTSVGDFINHSTIWTR
jgi:hypothetical protein